MKKLPQQDKSLTLRHSVATLAYRASKAIRDAPDDFSAFRPAEDSRSAGEILVHMCDLVDWVLTQAQGKERWRNSRPRTWEEDASRFFNALTAFDDYLASNAPLCVSPEQYFKAR